MIKCFTLILLALLFLTAHSQTKPSSIVNHTAKFAFSWFAGYCKNVNDTCSPDIVQRWDHQSFTIHGLWPDTKIKKKYGNFSIDIIKADPTLYGQMMNYWPPQSRNNDSQYKLWQHQWVQHGSDYAHIIHGLQPDRFAGLSGEDLNKTLQHAFFKDVIDIYLQFKGVQKYPNKKMIKKQFADALNIQQNQFSFSCASQKIVREAKVCLRILSTGIKPTPCKNLNNSQCAIDVEQWDLIEWKESTQERVFNLPPAATTQREEARKDVAKGEGKVREGGEGGKGGEEEEATQEDAKENEL